MHGWSLWKERLPFLGHHGWYTLAMLTPTATLVRRDSEERWLLQPGDIIGRMSTARCRLEDARVSEAHALLSLRGRGLLLVALRGELWVDDESVSEVELVTGLRLRLAEGVELEVEGVELPEQVAGIQVDDEAPRELVASVYSLVARGASSVELVPRYVDDSLARLVSTAEGYRVLVPGDRRRSWRPGRTWPVGAHRLLACLVDLSALQAERTQGATMRGVGMRLIARHSSTHLARPGREVVVVSGLPGRLLSELIVAGVPMGWHELARELWPPDEVRDRDRLRRRWDRALRRLRLVLREHGVRDDLVRSDGSGHVELVLLPGERTVDEA